jgi:integral membrane protein
MRTWFLRCGWLEGLSLLVLFFYAMPMKYWAGNPLPVRVVGSAHGVLFMVYVAMAFILHDREKWPNRTLIAALVLSSVPFGTWIFERKFIPSRAGSSDPQSG